MTVPFNNIPTTTRVPVFAAEFNSSQAQQGASLLSYKGLIVGQKLASGTFTANTFVKVSSLDQVLAGAGRGSMLHQQYLGWTASNKSTELWMGVLADDAAGVAAIGSILVGSAATATGTIALYLGGVRVTVGVNAGDSANSIATAIGAAINAAADLPVIATVNAATVTITYRHKGLVGNSFDVRHSFSDGESLPAGVALTITAVGTGTAGTTNPSLTALIAAMSDLWFHVWTHPYTDSTSLNALDAELASRLQPLRMTDALAITSASGTFSALTTLGTGRNSPSHVIVAQPGINPLTPPAVFAAEVAGLVAYYGQQDPARPFQTLAMSRAIAPAEGDSFDASERNLMLFDGVATTKRRPDGGVQLERIITTYQTSPGGAPDTAYLDATTPLTLMYLRFDWRARLANKYPRHKLADDGNQFGSGQAIMTPSLGKAEAVTWFGEKIKQGLVQNLDQFKRDLVCERNQSDRNRLDWLLPPNLMNQLVVGAASFQFRL